MDSKLNLDKSLESNKSQKSEKTIFTKNSKQSLMIFKAEIHDYDKSSTDKIIKTPNEKSDNEDNIENEEIVDTKKNKQTEEIQDEKNRNNTNQFQDSPIVKKFSVNPVSLIEEDIIKLKHEKSADGSRLSKSIIEKTVLIQANVAVPAKRRENLRLIRLITNKETGEFKHKLLINLPREFIKTFTDNNNEFLQNIPINYGVPPYSKDEIRLIKQTLLDVSQVIPLDETEDCSVLKICELFSNLFGMSTLITKQFELYFKYVNFEALTIFSLYSELNFNNLIDNLTISSIIKKIKPNKLLNKIPEYIKFLTSEFKKPIESIYTKNYIDLFNFNSKLVDYIRHFRNIYSDIVTIVNKIFSSLLLKWRSEKIQNLLQFNNKLIFECQSNYFYLILNKIEKYFLKNYPFCCGTNSYKNVNYKKNPYVYCFECKVLVCIKCIKNHSFHKNFDFANFRKTKDINILSSKDHGNEDIILGIIVNRLKSYVYDFFMKNKPDRKFFDVFDFMEIFLLEHLSKMILPFSLDLNASFNATKEFQLTISKLAENTIFVNGLVNTISELKRKVNNKITLKNYYNSALKVFVENSDHYKAELKYNRTIIEDLCNQKLALEFNLNKSVILSNKTICIETQSDNMFNIISQPISPTKYFSFLFEQKFENKKETYNYLETSYMDNFKNEVIFNLDLVSKNNCTSKYDILSVGKESRNINNRKEYTKDQMQGIIAANAIKVKDEKLLPVNDEKLMHDIDEIIPKCLNDSSNYNNSILNDKKFIYIDEHSYDLMRIKYREGFNSNYDLICEFIQEIMFKLCNQGTIKNN